MNGDESYVEEERGNGAYVCFYISRRRGLRGRREGDRACVLFNVCKIVASEEER